MKHIIQTIAVAFALFAIASCTEELIGPEANSVGKVAEYEVTLEASLGNGQQTKTVYDSAAGRNPVTMWTLIPGIISPNSAPK